MMRYLSKYKTKFKSLDDFVCCLPPTYLKNYVVGISSVAGQNGTPDSPRIIMYDKPKLTSTFFKMPKFMMSFNGGGVHNTQRDSIEIAHYNSESKELEFYDLRFEESNPKISAKNPGLCMVCHGEHGGTDRNGQPFGTVPFGGPKFIFDADKHWSRFAAGLQGCNRSEENILHDKLADKAVGVIKSEKRFRCLDQALLETDTKQVDPGKRYPNLASAITVFDGMNRHQEDIRSSRWVSHLPQFQQYKYFLFGYEYCRSPTLSEWFPPEKVKELTEKLKIDTTLKAPGNFDENVRKAFNQEWSKNLAMWADQKEQAIHPNFEGGLIPNYSGLSCNSRRPTAVERPDLFHFNEGGFGKIKRLEAVDQFLHGAGNSPVPFEMRIFLDGEGYGIGMIQSVISPYNPILLGSDAHVSLSDEPEDSKIKKLFKRVEGLKISDSQFAQGFLPESHSTFIPIGGRSRVCSELKTLSLEQFEPSHSDYGFRSTIK